MIILLISTRGAGVRPSQSFTIWPQRNFTRGKATPILSNYRVWSTGKNARRGYKKKQRKMTRRRIGGTREEETRAKRLEYYDRMTIASSHHTAAASAAAMSDLIQSLEKHLHVRDVREKRSSFLDRLQRKTKKRKPGSTTPSPRSTPKRRRVIKQKQENRS